MPNTYFVARLVTKTICDVIVHTALTRAVPAVYARGGGGGGGGGACHAGAQGAR